VLVVDNDPETRELLRTIFTVEGYSVIGVGGVEAARSCLHNHDADVVITELRLGDGTGFDLLEDASSEPVLVLTSATADEPRLRAFRMGADDYVTKPFILDEIVARVRAVLRRTGRATRSDVLVFDELEIDLRSRAVTVAGRDIEMTAKEFDLLAFLASNPGRVYTRGQLLTEVWQSSPDWQQAGTVTEHVRRLRRKLENPSGIEWLTTVRSVGYRFGRRRPIVPTASHMLLLDDEAAYASTSDASLELVGA
jgi:DNA-binding response OmpR family regulator